MKERRQFTRLLLDATAYIQQSRKLWKTQVHDLSLSGALIAKPDAFFPVISGTLYLTFTFSDSPIEIEMEMQVIHTSKNVMGLKCTYIDMENITHLKALLRERDIDLYLLEREFHLALVEQKLDHIQEYDKRITSSSAKQEHKNR